LLLRAFHISRRRYFTGLSGLYSEDDVEAMPYSRRQKAENWKGELKVR
jgi:hypothetical protein